jgi:nicotinate-nucleotide adenylyltransferase
MDRCVPDGETAGSPAVAGHVRLAVAGRAKMIGVYGGRFDPVHFGHLRTALEVCDSLELRQLRFMPCGQPPHRGPSQASGEQRRAMLELALGESDRRLAVDSRELDRDGPSYMVDSLSSLRSELGTEPLCLIIGQDALQELHNWHRWKSLLELSHLAVVGRPDTPERKLHPQVAAALQDGLTSDPADLDACQAGRVYRLSLTQLAISATQIRALIAQGRSARYLLPDAVLSFIQREGLYAGKP